MMQITYSIPKTIMPVYMMELQNDWFAGSWKATTALYSPMA